MSDQVDPAVVKEAIDAILAQYKVQLVPVTTIVAGRIFQGIDIQPIPEKPLIVNPNAAVVNGIG